MEGLDQETMGLRQKIQSGEVVLGTLSFEFHTFGLPEVIAKAGGDFVVIDLEATSLSMDRLGGILRAARHGGAAVVVRVPEMTKTHVGRCLDAGAGGIMAPMVESAAQAAEFVSLAKYPPAGRRGAAFGISHDDYDSSDPDATMQRANREIVLMAQIESRAGVDHAADIAAVDGIDVLWIGHNDLLNSLGLPNDRSHPEFLAAVERVRQACVVTGKALAGVAASPSDVTPMIAEGYRCLSLMSDVRLLQHAFSLGVKARGDAVVG